MAVPNPFGAIQMAAKLAPNGTARATTHGIRLPHLLLVLSDNWPASGSFTMFHSVYSTHAHVMASGASRSTSR